MLHKNKVTRVGSMGNRKAYQFLIGCEKAGHTFTPDDLVAATGWKIATARQYLSTRVKPYVLKQDGTYRANGCTSYSEEDFVHLVSQSVPVSRNPLKPDLPQSVDSLVAKARDAAIISA